MSQEDIKEIELNIERAKELVSKGDALERLMQNADFKQVILEDYLDREAVRLVHLKSDQNMQTDEDQRAILGQMDAIGAFTTYMNAVRQAAYLSRSAIEEGEEARAELIAEGVA